MSVSRHLCPKCDAVFDDGTRVCPHDGEDLIPLRDPDGLVGRVVDGRFEVKRLLGRGGMGSVYLAHQRSVDRLVALKVLKRDLADDEAQVKRFILEARAASRLASPHTITIHDFGKTDDGLLYIAMEHLKGRTLRDRLEAEGRLPVEAAAALCAQIATSLAEAHEHGIVHRDIKPENVFLVAGPRGAASTRLGADAEVVKVLDFGIARARTLTAGAAMTHTGVIMGTPAYMSPEAILGQDVDARADVYGLGIMLYELLTGAVPYQAETPMQVLLKHLHTEPLPVEKVAPHVRVPRALHRFLWRCLAKDRAQRPKDGAEFLVQLDEALKAAERGETEDLVPIFTTGEGFRVTEEALAAITTERRLQRPFGTESDPGGMRQASDIVIEHRASLAPWLVAAAAVMLALGVAAFFLMRPRAAEPTPVAPAAATPAPAATAPSPEPPAPQRPPTEAAETVSVTVLSEPLGAEVTLAGRPVGVTPWMERLPRGDAALAVTLTLAGYRPTTFDLVPDRDRMERHPLAPEVRQEPVAAPVSVPPPTPEPAKPHAPTKPGPAKPTPSKPARAAEEYLP